MDQEIESSSKETEAQLLGEWGIGSSWIKTIAVCSPVASAGDSEVQPSQEPEAATSQSSCSTPEDAGLRAADHLFFFVLS